MSTTITRAVKANRHFLTLRSVAIDPRYLDDPGFALGSGIDLSIRGRPLLAPFTAFEGVFRAATPLLQAGLPTSSEIIQESTTIKESLDDQEEASVLSAFFKVSYMLVSAEAAVKVACAEKKTYHTMYALLEHSGEQHSLNESSRHWRSGEVPPSEATDDTDQALQLFVSRYGSHYINTIVYGLRIAVQGKVSKQASQTSAEVSATFKGAFQSFSADAGAHAEQRKKLESMNVNLVLEAVSGGQEGGGLLVAQGLDEITVFLNDLKEGRKQFRVAPIRLILKPYFPTLDPNWNRTRAALDPSTAGFVTPGAPYGVPKGTIVAWHPTADFIQGLDPDSYDLADPATASPRVIAPDGWAICDGTQGTPNLNGRFIRGVASWPQHIATGGEEMHDHGGTTAANEQFGQLKTWGSTKHRLAEATHVHNIAPARHLPPYADLLYIMKLDDRP